MRRLLFIILYLSINVATLAQHPVLQHFTVQDGLPSSHIYTAFEDSKGYLWFGTDKGITRFNGYEFELFDMEGSRAASDVWGVAEDKKGRLWLSTFNDLIYYENETFHVTPLPDNFPHNMVQGHYFDEKGNHFVRFVNANGIHQIMNLDPLELRKVLFIGPKEEHKICFLKEDEQKRNWFSLQTKSTLSFYYETQDSLHLFKEIHRPAGGFFYHNSILLPDSTYLYLSQEEIFSFDFKEVKSQKVVDVLQQDIKIISTFSADGEILFLPTTAGTLAFDKDWKQLEGYHFINDYNAHNVINDSRGNLWMYTQNDGIYMLPALAKGSTYLNLSDQEKSNAVFTMTRDKEQQLWMGMADGHLKVLGKEQKLKEISIKLSIDKEGWVYRKENPIIGLNFDNKDNLIIGYQDGTVGYIPQRLLHRKNITITKGKQVHNSGIKIKVDTNDCFITTRLGAIKSMNRNDEGDILLATSSGVKMLNIVKDSLVIRSIKTRRTYTTVSQDNLLWTGNKRGVLQYDLKEDWNKYGTPLSLNYPINDLAIGQDKKLWIATDGNGLYRYYDGMLDSIPEFEGKGEIIKSLFVDVQNNLWMATNKGVSKLKVKSESPFIYDLKKITKTHGLATGEVNQVEVHEGKIYAATMKGLTILEEAQLEARQPISDLYLTNILINNKLISCDELEETQLLQLPYDSNQIVINYVCLSHESLKNIQYEYRLEGIDQDWQLTNATQKEYAALPVGEYTFRIRAKDINGRWTPEQQLGIKIKPPLWRTGWAYLLYIILIALGAYLIYQYQLNKALQERALQRVQELNEFKSRFYTNITHEFRTPLTIILGFVQQLKKRTVADDKKAVNLIEKHGTRLLTLINQLLDLNKLEANEMSLKLQHQDIIPYISYLVNLFESTAASKNIKLVFYKEIAELEMDYDAEKLQTIFYNLLFNAIKFTPEGGEIIVHTSHNSIENQLLIKIRDTGHGIRPEVLTFIFNRFYQDKETLQPSEGSGIGLALAKELIEQMGGKIEVESNQAGTLFTIYLPVRHTAEATTGFSENEQLKETIAVSFPTTKWLEEEQEPLENTTRPQVLIVEDNADLRTYLQAILKADYKVMMTTDGVAGIEKAFETIPDLIISDVMMPKKDGLELCSILKNDERTSHIPIVLLTGKSALSTKIQGLEYGADAYLVKPFVERELLLRLKNLHEMSQQLQKRYADFALKPKELIKPATAALPIEDAFLQKVRTVVEEHIDDPNLNVSHLCHLLAMSRSQLHKKLTALTGKSTTHFIRNIRMNKAQFLLKNSDLSIAEIAYQTGFEAQYFSTVFNRTFGMPPSTYRQQ